MIFASPAPPLSPPDAADLAALFPELEMGAALGAGGMGFVFAARQRSLDRRVALKLVPAAGASPERRERFEREVQALARLNHPHIVALFDVGERGAWFYLVMEFLEGEDLAQRLRRGPLPPRQALDVAVQMCEALMHAHAAGVVHRDVKPANVLLGTHAQVKLADFGLAKLLQPGPAGLTGAATLLRTPHYMPPEQRRDSWAVDERADLYALGVVLYEMLTGRLPEGRFALPSRSAGTSPALDATVLQAMATEPDARFQSAQAMHAALVNVAGNQATFRHRRYSLVMRGLVVGVLCAAAVVPWLVSNRHGKSATAPALKLPPSVPQPQVSAGPTTLAAPLRQDRTKLHAAVESRDVQALAALLRDKQGIDQPDKDGWTPLLLAVAADRADMLEALHQAGARIDAMLPGKKSALHIAAGCGSLKAAVWLQAHGAALDARDECGWRPLDWAAACLRPDMVRWLVQQGVRLQPEDGGKAPPFGLKPLHLAADAGLMTKALPDKMAWHVVWRDDGSLAERCVATVRLLLDLGAGIHELDESHLSALHHAAAANQAGAVALLIERGTDVNDILPPAGLTPLAMAAETNATAAMRVLFEKGARSRMPVEMESPLHKAARNGHVEAVQLLLEHGADVKSLDMRLATPLHRAAFGGRVAVMKLLLAKGAELEARDIQRCTPLHHAASAGRLEAVQLLCDRGASLLARDAAGHTAAEMAVQAGFAGVANRLQDLAAREAAESKK